MGGNQSNAFMSLSALCQIKNCPPYLFHPTFLKALLWESKGNFTFTQNTKKSPVYSDCLPQKWSLNLHLRKPSNVFHVSGWKCESCDGWDENPLKVSWAKNNPIAPKPKRGAKETILADKYLRLKFNYLIESKQLFHFNYERKQWIFQV